jgi:hypothetical protein
MAPTPLKPIYWDKTDNSKRLLGPVSDAIDGDEETAWASTPAPAAGINPAGRLHHRKALWLPQGTILNIYLKRNHGGWNSDDNQNNNLGRHGACPSLPPPTPSRRGRSTSPPGGRPSPSGKSKTKPLKPSGSSTRSRPRNWSSAGPKPCATPSSSCAATF